MPVTRETSVPRRLKNWVSRVSTCRDGRIARARITARRLLRPASVFRLRPTRIRGLTFYRAPGGLLTSSVDGVSLDPDADELVHARSRFQSVDDPDLFALYAVHDLEATPATVFAADHHTLRVVREFRRVPLDASALALALFRARGGHVASVIAAVAHWAERAVSLSEPAYLLVAHSLEEPRLIALLTGVHECRALASSRASAFSVDSLLAEARPLLMADPEWYAYCAPKPVDSPLLISAV